MRHKTRTLSFILGVLLLTACNGTDLQVGPTQTPKLTLEATATPPAIASLPTTTPAQGNTPPAPRPTSRPKTLPGDSGTVVATVQPKTTVVPNTTVEAGSAELNREIAQVETDEVKVRGLKPKADVPETFLNPAQMHDNLVKGMNEDYSQAEAKRDANELWLLRLVKDPSIDLYQLQVDLLSEQVLGYYDPKQKDLFVLRNGKDLTPNARQTLAHEYTHAMQDEYFDLQKLLPDHSNDDDRSLAVRALVEGDATMAGLTYVRQFFTPAEIQQFLQENSAAPSTVLNSAPAYIRESLYFPYSAGPEFVTQLLAQGNGFRAVDKALADPPTSSEQLMHPEKYINSPRDMPISVSLPPLTSTLGTGWTMLDNGTTGEFDVKMILQENNATNAESAAAGWGGGSYAFYGSGTHMLMYEKLTWDTQKDADEYKTAIEQTFATDKKDGDFWVDNGRYFSLQTSGKDATLIASNDRDALTKAVQAKP